MKPPIRTRRSPVAAAVLGAVLTTVLAVSACGSGSSGAKASATGGTSTATGGASTAGFPATVKSCDEQLTFTKAPTRVIMLGDTDASILDDLGVLGHVIGRAGALRKAAYDAATLARLEAIPTIASTTLDTGGSKVSTETILAQRADLVIGYDTGLDRAALRAAGVPVYSPDSFCADYSVKKATFALVDNEVTKIGAIFGLSAQATALNAKLTRQAQALATTPMTGMSSMSGAAMTPGSMGTVAVLYITPGSSEFYAYGTSSMVQPIVEANGLRNVYDDQTKRVFDASMEDLLKRNPQYIVLLYGDGQQAQVKPTFLGFNGAGALAAVRSGKVLVMPFALTDPPTPLSIQGAVTLGALLKG